jgi:ankyrin repeat protein
MSLCNCNSPLHDAVEANDLPKTKNLIESKVVHVNALGKFNRTPLHLASKYGNIEILKFLIRNGADPNVKNIHGFTALYVAALANNVAAIEILVQQPTVNVNEQDLGGMTPLISAACNGCSVETISCLLNNGASTTIQDSLGRAAIDWAREKNFSNIHALLSQYCCEGCGSTT